MDIIVCHSFKASGLPHSFIITHQNRYQQCIGAFVLQAASEASKVNSGIGFGVFSLSSFAFVRTFFVEIC